MQDEQSRIKEWPRSIPATKCEKELHSSHRGSSSKGTVIIRGVWQLQYAPSCYASTVSKPVQMSRHLPSWHEYLSQVGTKFMTVTAGSALLIASKVISSRPKIWPRPQFPRGESVGLKGYSRLQAINQSLLLRTYTFIPAAQPRGLRGFNIGTICG